MFQVKLLLVTYGRDEWERWHAWMQLIDSAVMRMRGENWKFGRNEREKARRTKAMILVRHTSTRHISKHDSGIQVALLRPDSWWKKAKNKWLRRSFWTDIPLVMLFRDCGILTLRPTPSQVYLINPDDGCHEGCIRMYAAFIRKGYFYQNMMANEFAPCFLSLDWW